jgi:3-oxoadipate enol-lactonase
MPFLDRAEGRIHYQVSGPPGAPVLTFSNSLGTDLAMWDLQATPLARTYRLLRYDGRGHGQSSVTPRPYSIAGLANDVLSLLDASRIDRTDFCGLSLGGMIGMWLAVHAPARLGKLVLSNTAAKIGSTESWNARMQAVSEGGMQAIVEAVLERWYSSAFRSASPGVVEATRRTLLQTPAEGYVASCAALRDADLREAVSAIQAPTLIIAGTYDPATTPTDGRFLANRVPGSKYVELPAAHLSNLEASDAFTMALSKFLSS